MTTERKEKWTPGTYTTKPETPYVAAQVWADGLLIADVYGESRETRKANAQLFAAAPKMYEALVGFFAQDIPCPFPMNDGRLKDWQNWSNQAQAALAQARGEQS